MLDTYINCTYMGYFPCWPAHRLPTLDTRMPKFWEVGRFNLSIEESYQRKLTCYRSNMLMCFVSQRSPHSALSQYHSLEWSLLWYFHRFWASDLRTKPHVVSWNMTKAAFGKRRIEYYLTSEVWLWVLVESDTVKQRSWFLRQKLSGDVTGFCGESFQLLICIHAPRWRASTTWP